MVKHHYPGLFREDPILLAKAMRAGERIHELTQFLVHVVKAHEAGLRGKGSVTYHASCHLTRSLGVREDPLTLLSSLNGATFLPMPDATRCCGFGGSYSFTSHPEIARNILAGGGAPLSPEGRANAISGERLRVLDELRRRARSTARDPGDDRTLPALRSHPGLAA